MGVGEGEAQGEGVVWMRERDLGGGMGLWAHRRIGVSVGVGVGMGVSVGVGVSKGVDVSGGKGAVSKHPTSHSPQLSSTHYLQAQ